MDWRKKRRTVGWNTILGGQNYFMIIFKVFGGADYESSVRFFFTPLGGVKQGSVNNIIPINLQFLLEGFGGRKLRIVAKCFEF